MCEHGCAQTPFLQVLQIFLRRESDANKQDFEMNNMDLKQNVLHLLVQIKLVRVTSYRSDKLVIDARTDTHTHTHRSGLRQYPKVKTGLG